MSKQGADKQERAWNTRGKGARTAMPGLSCRAERKTSNQSPKGGFNQSIKKQNK
jgi:hypothetical protein